MNKSKKGQFNKKLTRTYKFKKKTGKLKSESSTSTLRDKQDEDAKIVVKNLPFQVKEDDVKKLLARFGPVQEVKLPKRPDGSLVGCAIVQFKNFPDASRAIFQTNKTTFLGRVICCDWAVAKSDFNNKLKKDEKKNKT